MDGEPTMKGMLFFFTLGLAVRDLPAESLSPPDSLYMGSMQLNCYQGKLAEARQAAAEAVKADARSFGDFDISTASRLEDLGVLNWRLGSMDEAERNLRRALNIQEVRGEPADIARLCLRLAEFYEEFGKLNESRIQIRRALDFYEEEAKAEAPDPLKLEARGLAYRLASFLGDDKALDFLKANVEDCEKASPKAAETSAQAKLDLALGLLDRGLIKEAHDLASSVMDWEKAKLSPKDIAREPAYQVMGRILLREKKKEESDKYFDQCLSLLGQSNSDKGAKAEDLRARAKIYEWKGDWKEAEKSYTQMSQAAERGYGKAHPIFALAEFKEGQMMLKSKETAQAREHLESAFKVWGAAYGPEHPALASCQEALGHLEEAANNHAEAAKHFQAAASILSRYLGASDPRVLNLAKNR
jgi:tetratricopeptide (TPR) repeat protein